jgi:G:T-mismatch repair DNA endonuclease (very short patch repair protein)
MKKRKRRMKKFLKHFYDDDGVKKETSIEKKVRVWLEKEGIPFQQEKFLKTNRGKWYCYDFYITDGVNYTFMIETDGGFFHGQEYYEGKKSLDQLYKTQRKNYYNDKRKNKLASDLGIPLLRFWEKDIKFAFEEKVAKLILEEIKKQRGQ